MVVPALRTATIDRLLWSLAQNSVRPDAVSLVSTRSGRDPAHGLDVRCCASRRALPDRRPRPRPAPRCRDLELGALARPDARRRPRRACEPRGVEPGAARARVHFWGTTATSPSRAPPERLLELRRSSPSRRAANDWHLWLSCYGARSEPSARWCRRTGFDLASSCRQSGEDESSAAAVGRAVFIHEPPFAWHPTEPEPWGSPASSNLCEGEHRLTRRPERDAGLVVPALPVLRGTRRGAASGRGFLPYDPAKVEVTVRRAWRGRPGCRSARRTRGRSGLGQRLAAASATRRGWASSSPRTGSADDARAGLRSRWRARQGRRRPLASRDKHRRALPGRSGARRAGRRARREADR